MTSEEKSKVASSLSLRKFIPFIFMAIIAAIIMGQNFFTITAQPEDQTPVVEPANPELVKINLGHSIATPATPVQQPPIAHPPPVVSATPPRPQNFMNEIQRIQAEEMRLKSPSLVYSAEAEEETTQNQNSEVNNNANNPNLQFAQQVSQAQVMTVKVKHQKEADYKIYQGKIIPAVLETAIHSDLPGMARAVVNENVFSESGRVLLLPKGTRLIGQYNSAIDTGQSRVYIVWSRAITPSNIDIALGSPGIDVLGQAGMGGKVDDHFGKIFGTSILLSILGASASQFSANNNANNLGAYGNPYQMAVIQGLLNNSNAALQNNMNIKPTIHIQQGTQINLFVVRDLDFSSVLSKSA